MGLELYRKKRNFKTTPEPAGRVHAKRGTARMFVIQKHQASHLHYDFRLELNGVLLSWAVPKGPSLDPHDRRLAMHVEDHPIEYGDFEGVIPPKQYGSGTVLLWDRGTWIPKGDPETAYAQGKLKFELDGEKLHGGWTLVKSSGGKYDREKSWLLIKENDEYARFGADAHIVDTEPDSVASGRSLDAIAADPDRVWHSNKSVAENMRTGRIKRNPVALALSKVAGARKAAQPETMEAELATLVERPPSGDQWLHEIKYDGYRMLARVADGKCRIVSRTGKDWTASFPTIADATARLPIAAAWIDGEIVVMDAKGRTSFQALQNVLSEGASGKLVYCVFDLPYVNGYDLRDVPLETRKSLLAKIGASGALIRYSDHVKGNGPDFFGEACKLSLEGIVSKRADSPYRATRGHDWQKIKCGLRQEFVIGGYTDPQGSRAGFGALLLGVYEGRALRYCGKVGTGFGDAMLKALAARLHDLASDKPPFANPPIGAEGRRAHWVRPELVGEVSFTEWTRDGTLRHPSFEGLREDKPAREVVREDASRREGARDETSEKPQRATSPKTTRTSASKRATKTTGKHGGDAPNEVAGVAISNGAKLLYPEAGITKLDVARYYEAIGELIVPQIAERPLTLVRCPNGWDKKCFYQKHAKEGVSEFIDRIDIRDSGGVKPYMMAMSVSAVVALSQMGVLELHPWGSRTPALDKPDRLIFDFDPDESLAFDKLVDALTVLRKLLDTLGLEAFLKTTGGKGLHAVIPIAPTRGWEDVKEFCRAVAELLVRTFPDRYTATVSKSRRSGLIYVDYLRNVEGATAVAAYSVRAKARAPVAMPIDWAGLGKKDVRFDCYNLRNVPGIVARRKRDPWERLPKVRQALTDEMLAKVGIAGSTRRR
ncbi:MAG TPA: DNA ligase D [Casimicrobiaceae bacterium]|nr:DNA ligase D [Casimicrobiaceae bacterium]